MPQQPHAPTPTSTGSATPPALAEGRPVRELVVPVADDGLLDRVVPLLSQLSSAWSVPIRLVHVTPSISSNDPTLDAAADRIRAADRRATVGTTHLYGDDPAVAIADTVGAGSLLVMGSDHIDRWRCDGSVAEDVIERLRAPVLLVGPGVTRDELRDRGLRGEVIVGVDGTTAAEEGIETAAQLAAGIGQPLRLVDVVAEHTDDQDPHPLPGRHLQTLGERHEPQVETCWEVIVANDPVAGLEALASRRNASFLVATTTGRRAPDRRTMASISAGLAETAARPVLVVSADRGRAIEPVDPTQA